MEYYEFHPHKRFLHFRSAKIALFAEKHSLPKNGRPGPGTAGIFLYRLRARNLVHVNETAHHDRLDQNKQETTATPEPGPEKIKRPFSHRGRRTPLRPPGVRPILRPRTKRKDRLSDYSDISLLARLAGRSRAVGVTQRYGADTRQSLGQTQLTDHQVMTFGCTEHLDLAVDPA